MSDVTAATRPLSSRERECLDFLLSEDFDGADALRIQVSSTRAVVDGNEDPTFVVLRVMDPEAPRVNVKQGPVVVEAQSKRRDSPQELLLHVKDGLISVLELVVYTGEAVTELPPVESFDRPWSTQGPPIVYRAAG